LNDIFSETESSTLTVLTNLAALVPVASSHWQNYNTQIKRYNPTKYSEIAQLCDVGKQNTAMEISANHQSAQ
jgi:hypothetical protein